MGKSQKRRRPRLIRSRVTRVALPSASVLIATASAIVVNVLTTGWGWIWWVLLGVLVVLNIAVLVRVSDTSPERPVTASGPGSVAVGGDVIGDITTHRD